MKIKLILATLILAALSAFSAITNNIVNYQDNGTLVTFALTADGLKVGTNYDWRVFTASITSSIPYVNFTATDTFMSTNRIQASGIKQRLFIVDVHHDGEFSFRSTANNHDYDTAYFDNPIEGIDNLSSPTITTTNESPDVTPEE